MKAMFYLIRKEIKNTVIDMFRHPSRLLLYLFIIVMLGFSLFSKMESKRSGDYLDIRILEGAYLAVSLLIAVPTLLSGLKSGATFFKMSDVNFLFVSPISSKKILAYGLIKQMGSSFLMMFFLLFYGATASEMFGITRWQLIALVGGLVLLIFTMQVLALLVYSFSNGEPGRVQAVQAVLYGALTFMAAIVIVSFFKHGSKLESLLAAIASPYLTYIPVVGWIKGMVFAIIRGNTAGILVYSILNLLALAGSIVLFEKSDSDYYEDVLQSTETSFELRQSVKAGRSFQKKVSNRQIKVRDTGINHGWGANTFFYKHIRQSRRKSRLPFLSTSTVVMVIANLVFAIFLQKISGDGSDRMPTGYLMPVCLAASSYVLFFFNMAGDWSMELLKPYIYLVPESPFRKLVWASLSTVLKPAIDGVLIFAVLEVYLRANPATALLCMLLYASVGLLYVSVNVLAQRLFGQVANKGLTMLFYMLLLAVLFAPGAVISGLLYQFAGFLPGFVIGLPIAVWDIAVSLGVFAACRNLLSTVEYNF